MKSKRKVSIIVTTLTLAVLLLVGMTVAYLTDLREVTNKLGIGVDKDGTQNVLVSLKEPAFQAKAQAGDVVYGLPKRTDEPTSVAAYNLKPGDKIFKDPQIKNAGSDSIYVRVKIGMKAAHLQKLMTDLGLAINPAFVEKDGYYYYGAGTASAVLAKGSAAIDFFVIKGSDATNNDHRWTMTIPETWNNDDVKEFAEYMDTKGVIQMPIRVEAIQTQNFGGAIPWKNSDDSLINESDIIAANL